jgi:hypothetical protein
MSGSTPQASDALSPAQKRARRIIRLSLLLVFVSIAVVILLLPWQKTTILPLDAKKRFEAITGQKYPCTPELALQTFGEPNEIIFENNTVTRKWYFRLDELSSAEECQIESIDYVAEKKHHIQYTFGKAKNWEAWKWRGLRLLNAAYLRPGAGASSVSYDYNLK